MMHRKLIVASYVGAWIETKVCGSILRSRLVASYVGAWIETPNCGVGRTPRKVASYVGAWIETAKSFSLSRTYGVASYVGAWIETYQQQESINSTIESHPMWVRGLKQVHITLQFRHTEVASYVGAWIETSADIKATVTGQCRILCGCVD